MVFVFRAKSQNHEKSKTELELFELPKLILSLSVIIYLLFRVQTQDITNDQVFRSIRRLSNIKCAVMAGLNLGCVVSYFCLKLYLNQKYILSLVTYYVYSILVRCAIKMVPTLWTPIKFVPHKFARQSG